MRAVKMWQSKKQFLAYGEDVKCLFYVFDKNDMLIPNQEKGCYPGLTPTKKWVIYYSKPAAYNISIKLIGSIEHECNKQRNY